MRAHQDRLDILEYWINRNKSKTYSEKLYSLISLAIELIAEHPEIGRLTDEPEIRLKVIRDYYLVYEDDGECLNLLSIWDTRQDPIKLKKLLKKKSR
ncbi:MAG: type II toxin-antitoxin system RelE/ParE family toxin [Bacteroidota bacterium]